MTPLYRPLQGSKNIAEGRWGGGGSLSTGRLLGTATAAVVSVHDVRKIGPSASMEAGGTHMVPPLPEHL